MNSIVLSDIWVSHMQESGDYDVGYQPLIVGNSENIELLCDLVKAIIIRYIYV